MNAFKANKLANGRSIEKEILDTIYHQVKLSAKQNKFKVFINVANNCFDDDDMIAVMEELGENGYLVYCDKQVNGEYNFCIDWEIPMKRTSIAKSTAGNFWSNAFEG